jgi:hypothetical protein
MKPEREAFAVPGPRRHDVTGCRALLLDDTYVSGARAQSAAAALRLAGARAVLVVTLGRTLRPDRSALQAAFAERQPVATEPGAERCARCVQTGAATE